MGNPRHRQVNPLHGVTELTSEPEQSGLRPQPSGKSHFASSTLCPLESVHRQLPPNPAHLSRSPPVPPPPDPIALLPAPGHFLSPTLKEHGCVYRAQWSQLALPAGGSGPSHTTATPGAQHLDVLPSSALESNLHKTPSHMVVCPNKKTAAISYLSSHRGHKDPHREKGSKHT